MRIAISAGELWSETLRHEIRVKSADRQCNKLRSAARLDAHQYRTFPGAFCDVYQPEHVLRCPDGLVRDVENEVARINPSTRCQPTRFNLHNHDALSFLAAAECTERKELQSKLRVIFVVSGLVFRRRQRRNLGGDRGPTGHNGNPFFASLFPDAEYDY